MSRAEMSVSADWALRTWAKWMREPSDLRGMWFPSSSCGFSSAGSGAWEDFEEGIDGAMARGVDAIVSGLPLLEQSALYHVYLASVFRGRGGVLEDALDSAVAHVGQQMKLRGLL